MFTEHNTVEYLPSALYPWIKGDTIKILPSYK